MTEEGMEACRNGYFRRIRRHWMFILWRTQKMTIVQLYNHYLHYFTLFVCSGSSTTVITLVALYSEKGFENCSFIGQ